MKQPTLPPGYQYFHKIGEGGQGEVWLVHHETMGRYDVVKILSERENYQSFLAEIQAMAALDHTNIARIYYTEPGGDYFIMEFLAGGSLQSMLRQRDFSLLAGVKALRQVLDGLAFAHSKGLVHRDLKPDNIMFAENGAAKIVDFGMVHRVDHEDASIPEGLMGSPRYMAPEQWVNPGKVDSRCDLWAVGLMLYRMLTGNFPFSGSTLAELMYAALKKTIPILAMTFPWEKALASICQRALERDVEKRYQSAAEMANDLDQALALFAPLKPLSHDICPRPKSVICPYDLFDCVSWQDWRDGSAVMVRHNKGWSLAHMSCLLRRKQQKTAKIGQYRLLARLNRKNPFGHYYLATADEQTICVLNHLPTEQPGCADPQQWQRMLRRVNRGHKVITALPDTLVVMPGQIQEIYESQYRLYYTMPYIPALNLKQILRSCKKLSWRQVLPAMYQLAYVLSHLHRCNIVHRDLKPAHILCSVEGNLLLSGFAMAKYESSDTSIHETTAYDFAINTIGAQANYTVSGKALGNVSYMAPEQTIDAAAVSTKADVWSWGVIVCEMMIGQSLFGGGSMADRIERTRSYCGTQQSVAHFLPSDVPNEIINLINSSLIQEPQQRITTRRLAERLLRIIARELPERMICPSFGLS